MIGEKGGKSRATRRGIFFNEEEVVVFRDKHEMEQWEEGESIGDKTKSNERL